MKTTTPIADSRAAGILIKIPFNRLFAKQAGFSLIEIMVALTLGLILMSAAVQIFTINKQTYTVQEALSRLQENGRFAFEILSRDLRMAGYLGCGLGGAKIANSLVGGGSSWKYMTTAIGGYEGGVSTFPSEYASDVIANTDSIVVRLVNTDTDAYTVNSHAGTTINLTSNHDLQQGEILVIVNANCTQIGVFQMTNNPSSPGSTAVVNHATGSLAPGNCTSYLGGQFTCANLTPASALSYQAGSSVLKFNANAYYIGTSESGSVPALFREKLTTSGGNSTTTAEELIQGVENMQIRYGVDTDTTPDGIANQYVTANNITNWLKVTSVRIYLLLRTINPISPQAQAYSYMGTTTIPSDRFLRRELVMTIQLRNRGL